MKKIIKDCFYTKFISKIGNKTIIGILNAWWTIEKIN